MKVYRISRELSRIGWNVYEGIAKEHRFSMGQQFIRAIDSIGANIAEGFGRYHYMDSVRFYYNVRGSLWESKHWIALLNKRRLLSGEDFKVLSEHLDDLGVRLNNFISSIKSKVNKNNDNE